MHSEECHHNSSANRYGLFSVQRKGATPHPLQAHKAAGEAATARQELAAAEESARAHEAAAAEAVAAAAAAREAEARAAQQLAGEQRRTEKARGLPFCGSNAAVARTLVCPQQWNACHFLIHYGLKLPKSVALICAGPPSAGGGSKGG
jgi:hypothetical protein